MFIKVVRHLDEEGVSDRKGNDNQRVVPTEHHLFDLGGTPVKEVVYKKVRVNNKEEWKKKEPSDYTVVTQRPKNLDDGFEYIEFQLPKDVDHMGREVWELYIAPNCSFYVMNNEGRTVDSLHCSTS